MSLLTIIGLFGVATVLVAYAMMTMGTWAASSARYQWLNVIGTSGILASLIPSWNLPAFVANSLWILIGAVSLVRIYRKKDSSLRGSESDRGNPSFFVWPRWIASLCARNDGANQ